MFNVEYWWVLLLLPLPLLVRWLVPPSILNGKNALNVPFYSRVAGVFSNVTIGLSSSSLKIFIASLIWCLLVLSASNPVWLGKPIAIERSGRAIMLAVDLSGSMNAQDMMWRGKSARRIDIVKAIASSFIDQRKGDRLGLILFGSNAYLQAPLTFDRKTVKDMMEDASVGLAGQQTAIGDAIGLAIKSLGRYADKEKILILLTDGANNAGHVAPKDVSELAKKNNIRIFTVGLAANQVKRSSFFGPFMANPSDDLDEKSLRDIAKKTGGMFFRASDAADLKKVYATINELVPVKSDQAYFQPKTPIYPWLLGFCLLVGFVGVMLSFFWNMQRERGEVS